MKNIKYKFKKSGKVIAMTIAMRYMVEGEDLTPYIDDIVHAMEHNEFVDWTRLSREIIAYLSEFSPIIVVCGLMEFINHMVIEINEYE